MKSLILLALVFAWTPAFGQGSRSTGWQVRDHADAMTNKETRTLLSWAYSKRSSLRVACNDAGGYIVLLTLPKSVQPGSLAITELRIDQGEVAMFTLSPIPLAALAKTLGGSDTDANYSIAALDPAKGLMGETREAIAEGGRRLVQQMRTGARLAYRLTLATAAEDATGVFDISGFAVADKRAAWSCGK